jgi:hypothetical protein
MCLEVHTTAGTLVLEENELVRLDIPGASVLSLVWDAKRLSSVLPVPLS